MIMVLKIKWEDIYEDGECPVCCEPIPEGTEEGDECSNCGHEFFKPRAEDLI